MGDICPYISRTILSVRLCTVREVCRCPPALDTQSWIQKWAIPLWKGKVKQLLN